MFQIRKGIYGIIEPTIGLYMIFFLFQIDKLCLANFLNRKEKKNYK